MGYRNRHMNTAIKQGVFEEKLEEYLQANKRGKSMLLDVVTRVTGLHRKSAVRRFKKLQLQGYKKEKRGRPTYYTPDCIEALEEIWKMGSEACGENLHSQIAEYVTIQIREHEWKHSDIVTGKLRAMSLGSMKKYVGTFFRTRRNFGGKSTTRRSSTMSMVPIRMDGWDKAEAGVTQVDTVAHCGGSLSGDFTFTTNGTDVATLWGTRRAQWNKGQEVTRVSLEAMRKSSAVPWTEMHPDSGSEFINAHCYTYATETDLRMTRSRPNRKNDNCYVEERNGHVVRAYVGFDRLDARESVAALNRLYDVLTPYLNHFIASRRIVSKERVGARWKITREKVAKTPYQRVLERNDVTDEVKNKLRTEHATLNPAKMKREIDLLTKQLYDIQKRFGNSQKLTENA